jgi:hypothetical protein
LKTVFDLDPEQAEVGQIPAAGDCRHALQRFYPDSQLPGGVVAGLPRFIIPLLIPGIVSG